MAFVRLPGKSERYIDTETGESISRRQYDKRFGILSRQGFVSYEARKKAEDYSVLGPFEKSHTIWHSFEFPVSAVTDLVKAITYLIEKSPHFGTKMMIGCEGTVYGEGKPYKKTVGTTVWKKKDTQILDMLKELDEAIFDYEIEFIRETYFLTFIDRSN